MATDKALIKKRKELRHQLETGEYKTLIDVFLEWFDGLFRKVTRVSKPLGLWIITVLLSLLVVTITLLATYIAGDMANFSIIVSSWGFGLGLGYLLVTLVVILTISTVFIVNQSLKRLMTLWYDHMLDATETIESLYEFENWLDRACNIRLHLVVTIIGGFLTGYLVVLSVGAELGSFIGYGISFSSIFVSFFLAAYGYQFLIAINIPAVLRKYELRLFSADPAISELLSRLSGELSFFVYFVAFYAALLTLATIPQGILQNYGIFVVIVLWVPIIAMFALNQTSLSSIVRRAKWKTLNEIQAKVEKLQLAKNFESKEKLDTINRLLDYHERIKGTRNSSLNLRTILSFINSLLLPLLAFILGNLDLVLNLFTRKP
ncbi:MAG TPA: hypothetical protein VLA72_16665 [Anaerolineales bacterium]|nr:hypothetical protein [Anaerolineales bacterium]